LQNVVAAAQGVRMIAAARSILTQAKSLGVTIKHEPFTGDQSNLQESVIAFHPVPRNEEVSFQERLANGPHPSATCRCIGASH